MATLNGELDSYLRQAWQRNEVDYEAPSHSRRFRSPMFEFVRAAKAHRLLGTQDAFRAADAVEHHLRSWIQRDGDPWTMCFPESDDGKTEFIETWERIRWPRAELDRAHAEATRLPLKPLRCPSDKYARFISVAGHLQKGVDGPILLPVAKIATLLECEPMSVSRYRSMAQNAGLLKLTKKGNRQQRKADEFSFAVELFDWNTGEQEHSRSLNICLTSETQCYTEMQDNHENQDTERNTGFQETHDRQEIQELQRYTRAQAVALEAKKCSLTTGAYIPTATELDEALKLTEHLRVRHISGPDP